MRPLDRPDTLLAKAAEDEALIAASVDNLAISDAIVGFHLQQAAEKLLKALLARRGVAYRRTHDLFELFGLLSASGLPLSDRLLRIGLYTPYAVVVPLRRARLGSQARPPCRARLAAGTASMGRGQPAAVIG